MDVVPPALAAAIDQHGGHLRVPHGRATVLVACAPGDAAVIALSYSCPPVRLIGELADLGGPVQRRAAQTLRELELLAVAEHARGTGVGTALLAASEEHLRQGGCKLVFAKVRQGDRQVLRWYRRRGYLPATPHEPVRVSLGGAVITFDDGGDGYQLVVKSLDATTRVARMMASAGSYLTVARRASPVTPQVTGQ
ncbi:GNAT family N-acetyltransferase [Sphaerisporangium album]|uniref:GNAT family N-acetyltransferase n=2 Tax=Sphaerisporangium album TaxID=509200 RepID=A0A367ESW9_9ACTN|nr:GNAT family N-acetyltransferase [Sphaerisporangium album]